MSALGSKLRRLSGGKVSFWCPGCDMAHVVTVDRLEGQEGPRWDWNEDTEQPSFSPSVLVRTGHFVEPQGKHCDRSGDPDWPCDCVCCHSFVTNGYIQFLDDCTHAMAGKTVPLPEFGRVQ